MRARFRQALSQASRRHPQGAISSDGAELEEPRGGGDGAMLARFFGSGHGGAPDSSAQPSMAGRTLGNRRGHAFADAGVDSATAGRRPITVPSCCHDTLAFLRAGALHRGHGNHPINTLAFGTSKSDRGLRTAQVNRGQQTMGSDVPRKMHREATSGFRTHFGENMSAIIV